MIHTTSTGAKEHFLLYSVTNSKSFNKEERRTRKLKQIGILLIYLYLSNVFVAIGNMQVVLVRDHILP